MPPRVFPLDDAGARRHHVLGLTRDVGEDELCALARARFASARWVDGAERVLRVSRHSALHGPYEPGPGALREVGFPPGVRCLVGVECPRERGEPPWPGTEDPAGLWRAFPDGLPVRDEERLVDWAVSVARYVGGSVRIADPALTLTPDPDSSIDVTVYSDVWLAPERGLELALEGSSRARLTIAGTTWNGPPSGVGEHAFPGTEVIDDGLRRQLHAEAEAFDGWALAMPDVLDGYGIELDLGMDGLICCEATGDRDLPRVVTAQVWAPEGVIAYRVRWLPPDVEELYVEKPSIQHRVARDRAKEGVRRLARAVHAAVGGIVANDDGFPVML
jgi:hypothetical protein